MTTDKAPERAYAYLIVKRDVYYKPNSQGYTGVKDHAGRYTLADVAARFPNQESPNQGGMYYIHEDDAPEYSKGCYRDVRLEHQRDKAIAEITALRARLEAVEAELAEADALIKATWADMSSNSIRLAETTHRAERAEAALATARRDALEEAAGLRDPLADLIGAKPMSSIHSALSEYANAIRALAAQEGEG